MGTKEDLENFIITRLKNDFIKNVAELRGKYGEFSTVPVYTALSMLICKLAVIHGMPSHVLSESILVTYEELQKDVEEQV